MPDEDAVELVGTDVGKELIKDWSLAAIFGRVGFPVDIDDVEAVSLCHSQHFLSLGIYRKSLFLLRLARFTGIQAVTEGNGLKRHWGTDLGPVKCRCFHTATYSRTRVEKSSYPRGDNFYCWFDDREGWLGCRFCVRLRINGKEKAQRE